MKKNNLLKSIAIIPARKNSKRLKNKNIKVFRGKPLIYWTIKTALKSKLFDKVFVSTDSIKIKKISENAGAEVLYPRPKKLAGDYVKILDVINFEVKNLEKKLKFQNVCCIFPTANLLPGNDLKEGLKKLTKNTNYVFSAKADSKSVLKNYFTQQLPKTYKDAGQFYWGAKKTWLDKKDIFSNKSKIISLKSKNIIDLDTMSDWKKMVEFEK